MLAGQPLAATISYGTEAQIITPFSMDLNGNGITVSNDVWARMKEHIPHKDGKPVHPISASTLKPVVDSYAERGEAFKMGMVFPVSTHNYELRYWLAAGGLHPGYYNPDNGDTSGQIDADVYRPDLYRLAAEELIAEGHLTADQFPDFDNETGFKPPQSEFIDSITYDGSGPNAYLEQFPIGLRVSLGIAWMVLIAAEMLAQNPGLGKFVWDEFQNGSSDSLGRIMMAMVVIGLIGYGLDRTMLQIQRWVSWDKTTQQR